MTRDLSSLWYLGTALGGAKLQVAKRDVAHAKYALQSLQSEAESSHALAWTCPQCHVEVDDGFDVCWSCETPRDEPSSDGVPANSQASESSADESADTEADADAARAFRTAIFGTIFAPLLPYAIYLLIKTMGQELTPAATRRFYAALAICIVFTVFWWQVLFRILRVIETCRCGRFVAICRVRLPLEMYPEPESGCLLVACLLGLVDAVRRIIIATTA